MFGICRCHRLSDTSVILILTFAAEAALASVAAIAIVAAPEAMNKIGKNAKTVKTVKREKSEKSEKCYELNMLPRLLGHDDAQLTMTMITVVIAVMIPFARLQCISFVLSLSMVHLLICGLACVHRDVLRRAMNADPIVDHANYMTMHAPTPPVVCVLAKILICCRNVCIGLRLGRGECVVGTEMRWKR